MRPLLTSLRFSNVHSSSFANHTRIDIDRQLPRSMLCLRMSKMFERFNQRSLDPENLDKGTYTPEEYEGCLVELRRINEWLGDANALRDSLLKEIAREDLRSFSLLDVGAGSG